MNKSNKAIRCIIVDDEITAREILETYLSKLDSVELVSSCKNAMEAFRVINSQDIDLVFLDINMPEISGLSFAKSVSKDIKIIFTTAYREYAVDGFDLMAVDYLLKPISMERLMQAIGKFYSERISYPESKAEASTEKTSDFLFVRSERKMVKIIFEDIRYLESIGDYLKIHLADQTIVTRESLSTIEAKLPRQDFIRIHRSYIVSMKRIGSYTNEDVEIEGMELPISRGYKETVLKRLKG